MITPSLRNLYGSTNNVAREETWSIPLIRVEKRYNEEINVYMSQWRENEDNKVAPKLRVPKKLFTSRALIHAYSLL